jgi:enamine deaminase RidA (YjgF/YER057c/UK114 family)
MTRAVFEDSDGPVETQAQTCFRHAEDFLDGIGQNLSAARSLIVEVSDRRNLPLVAEARRKIFGDQKPPVVSSRFARLPPGELVRVTVVT